ncbi:MAG: pyridoxal-5'-phosphate-dependent protein subunit beta [Deltaproteobacteria bacterium SG8_13]|nr:MAG: pyridoxal-5'-phosphate-dependent protein subunit beta [Deltaproteobacteria bacterium SG8_13]
MKFNYICSECGRRFEIEPLLTVCPDCSRRQVADQPLAGVLEVELHPAAGRVIDPAALLPVEKRYFPPIPVGNTPLWQPQALRREFGMLSLYIKDDGANPTSSLKDRASYLVSAFAAKHGIGEIVVASTGNAGSSMAGVGAAAGQKVVLFLPKTAPAAKLVQALQYGAIVYRVDGSYDLAYDLSLAYSTKSGGMSRNTAYNPMTIEGKKTVSLELFQQLKKAPDILFVGTGDGCITGGVYKGFRDLKQLGFIDRIPTVVSVQAENSDALHRAFHTGRFESKPAHTVADSICVEVPRNGVHALTQLKKFGGRVITVSDEMILAAQARLSRTAGLFTEPASAAAFAGFMKLRSDLPDDAAVVILATGNGLKDSAAATRGVQVPERVIRSLDDIT